ncbi:MAG: 50S ribosomal protein L17 [Candidatus Omnitrophica bacterium CG11_big_fil_rev_8_21_14_0_20_45_26]|uniref:50S ribosomal protein L17 n=1 Tax=Candidatus Abzuiibacterium crystallinum TaxID=1974748 RepID=A0A2H0LN55_9BACT|nr:MAG: 50S ribosomal protein L17 [Candidatus Omnitrophica bacterium CG11_big_fil_rev_8_21_14_0_20_45_26]PIW65082.1 MAG: 50S ribosomal protein L17 [Candidatus Omnitrophica bacterium CG12_big_fil_rev_8_21_14_0_65_45_16]
MWHRKHRGRLSLETEHRVSLLRNLAKELVAHQRVVTTHLRAKEASRFADKLVTIAKKNTLHARRQLISELGSGTEAVAKRLIDVVAPKFSNRQGGYTRVLQYKVRKGDGAQLALLEWSTTVEEITKKPRKEKKKKTEKPAAKETPKKAAEKKQESPAAEKETESGKETAKKGGFLSGLRKFLTGKEE